MKAYIEKILLPYVHEKRKDLKLSHDNPALVIFDHFSGQVIYVPLKQLGETIFTEFWFLQTTLTDYNH